MSCRVHEAQLRTLLGVLNSASLALKAADRPLRATVHA
jgi:hypothetical protein